MSGTEYNRGSYQLAFMQAVVRVLPVQRTHERSTMATIELTGETFNETVRGEGITIVDFWAPWCGPCRQFGPIFDKASEENHDVTFAKVNTEEQQALAGALGISSIPTLMVFRDDVLVYREAGALPAKALDALLTEARNLDMSAVKAEIAAQQSAQSDEN